MLTSLFTTSGYIKDNCGTDPVLDRINTVIREIRRYGVVDVLEPEDLKELRSHEKSTQHHHGTVKTTEDGRRGI